jgi:hypothetical protein
MRLPIRTHVAVLAICALVVGLRGVRATVPYETASPHRPFNAIARVLVGVSDASFATVAACGLGDADGPKPDCDGTEGKPFVDPACPENCTGYHCVDTGNDNKFCAPKVGTPGCDTCSTTEQVACKPRQD